MSKKILKEAKDSMSLKLFGKKYSDAVKTNFCLVCQIDNIKEEAYDKNSAICLVCINKAQKAIKERSNGQLLT